MAIKSAVSNTDVVTASRQRIKNVFSNGVKVYMSFSGGKDSICLANVVYELIQGGEIDPSRLTVIFIDEEAIFPCVEKITKEWRKRFLLAGAEFRWYCLEVRHFNCFNQLTEDESFVCWDEEKKDVWVRTPTSFAIRDDPNLKHREDNYQSFLPKVTKDGIMITGVRAAESIQRRNYMAAARAGTKGLGRTRMIYPIYDWRDRDIWKYLRDNHLDIPDIYLYMWQSGTAKNHLRVSQFFSSDTAGCLVKMNEYYPDLMERVIRREPNAYLAALYWDSEMFGRQTSRRKAAEGEDTKDYREMVKDMLFVHPDLHFHTEHQKYVAQRYRKMVIKFDGMARMKDYKDIYNALVAGDPKMRTLRAIYTRIGEAYARYAKHYRQGGEHNGES